MLNCLDDAPARCMQLKSRGKSYWTPLLNEQLYDTGYMRSTEKKAPYAPQGNCSTSRLLNTHDNLANALAAEHILNGIWHSTQSCEGLGVNPGLQLAFCMQVEHPLSCCCHLLLVRLQIVTPLCNQTILKSRHII